MMDCTQRIAAFARGTDLKRKIWEWNKCEPDDDRQYVCSPEEEQILADYEQATREDVEAWIARQPKPLTEEQSIHAEDLYVDETVHKQISDRVGGDAYFGLPPREHHNS
jgi:hypothetical protein